MRNAMREIAWVRRSAVLAALLLAACVGLLARSAPAGAQSGRIDVFLEQDPTTNTARLYFMDPLSGLSTVASVESGRGFALLGDYVLYEKSRTGAVMRVNSDGSLEPHGFIRRAVDTVALDWVTSSDGRAVAWTVVNAAGESAAYIAWADGSDLRQLPLLPEQSGSALHPLALAAGRTQFFYDAAHPVPPQAGAPEPLYAPFVHLAEYDIEGEMFFPLPDEPNCPCAAAVTSDGRIMARLEAEGGTGPFALHIWDLPSSADILIPAAAVAYAQAGDLLLNDNGTLAVYSAASESPLAYVLVLVDVTAGSQSVVLGPEQVRFRPLAFIDDDSALLLTTEPAGGTYKLDLQRGTTRQVSDKRYLGAITTP